MPDAGRTIQAGSPLADSVAGTFAFAGILAALLHRARTGEGQHVDVSMVDCLLALVLDESPDVWGRLGLPTRVHALDTWEGEDHAGRYGEARRGYDRYAAAMAELGLPAPSASARWGAVLARNSIVAVSGHSLTE